MFRKVEGARRRTAKVTVTVDGASVEADEGESIAAVLLRMEPLRSRATPISGAPRAPFCMMGVCFDCLAEIDGVTSTRTCLAPARDGMTVRRQAGRPDPAAEVAA